LIAEGDLFNRLATSRCVIWGNSASRAALSLCASVVCTFDPSFVSVLERKWYEKTSTLTRFFWKKKLRKAKLWRKCTTTAQAK
jgi:hypothetical protein